MTAEIKINGLDELIAQVAWLLKEVAELKKSSLPPEKEFFGIGEVAKLMGVHYNTIYRSVRAGDIPAIHQFRTYRIPRKYLESQGLK